MPQDDPPHPPLAVGRVRRYAFGRALGDFRLEDRTTQHGLYPAEEKLLAAVRLGEDCEIDSKRPEQVADTNRVRGLFIRFLALGGDACAPVHEKGVRLQCAYIAGPLDLQGCRDVRPLRVRRCWFDSTLVLRDAQTGFLHFDESRLPGLAGDHVRIASDVCLRACQVDGEVRFRSAEIDGNLECDGGMFRNRTADGQGSALVCDGAKITGSVYLRSIAEVPFRAEGLVRFRGVEIGGTLACNGGTFQNRTANEQGTAFVCDGTKIAGSVFLKSTAQASFRAEGEMRFLRVEIGGNLECDGGTFQNRTDDGQSLALTCDGAKIAGNVFLRGAAEKPFRAEGAVRFHSAEIGGYLECRGASFQNRTADGRGIALDCGRAKIAGDVFLSGAEAPFSAVGVVRLAGSEIGGDVDCANGTFDNYVPDPATTDARGQAQCAAFALTLDRARVLGTLWLGPSAPPHAWPVTIHGSLDLRGCYAHHLLDHPSTWPKPPGSSTKAATGEKFACTIALDNFTYDRFVGRGQYNAPIRARWLLRQPQRHLGEDFRHQPFVQLIKVLHEMGREDDARRIAIFKQRMRRRAGWGKLWRDFRRRPKRWWGWIAVKPAAAIAALFGALGFALQWLFFDFLLGGGYAKAKPIALFALMLVGGALYYEQAASRGAIVPVDQALANNQQVRMACADTKEPPLLAIPINWHRCKQAPADLNHFNAWIYSLDLMLPLIQLGQKRDWQPASVSVAHEPWGFALTPTQVVAYGQQILSLVLYLLIAAIVSGVIKRE
ncbi:MAG: hypothetical protein ACREC6_04155 [Hyphomicrobiaceae bacterium]